ncbi:MAG: T9SS type A sorting domain-containing protein [Bacteroidales bacterium]|nr:T9SS type A sorting domain-containing protein [Bacteroidales bacterium]MBN2757696.1 T9SS type A sorting domain-containing protein [Bacteroidales bacterium]
MKRLVIAFAYIFVYLTIKAQIISPEAMVSSGASYNNSYAQISFTLGELQSATYKNDNIILTQGFMQSDFSISTLSKFENSKNFTVKVFPNPVKDNLNIKFESNNNEKLIIQLYDISGKQILTKTLKEINKIETINFEKYNNGIYILKTISSTNNYFETFKIIFQN